MNKLQIPDWMLTADEDEFQQQMTELENRTRRGLAPGRKWRFQPEGILQAIEEGPTPSFHGLSIPEQVEELDRTLGDRVHLGTRERRLGSLAYLLRLRRDSLTSAIQKSAARQLHKGLESDREQKYTNKVQPGKREVVLDLNKLRSPDKAKVLIDIVQEADLSSEALTAIRDAARERLMRCRAFGNAEPTVEAFQRYLDSLSKVSGTSYQEKREICTTVNHWKRRLGVTLLFKAPGERHPQACNLSVTSPHRDDGGFQLRTPAPGKESIYGAAPFPPLRLSRTH